MPKPGITVLFDSDADPPAPQDWSTALKESKAAEFYVGRTLDALGYKLSLLGVRDNLTHYIDSLREQKPKAVFNLIESWNGDASLDYCVAGVLEMLEIPYTGANPNALQLSRDKALSKKILDFHGVRVPEFVVVRREAKVLRPSDLRFPLIVKPLDEDASLGIAQTSVVYEDKDLEERVKFIHDNLQNDAIVEELIVGREIYLAILGNDPPKCLTPIEMVFEKEQDEELKIATYNAKWSAKYREDKGIKNVTAKKLGDELLEKIQRVSLTTYEKLRLRDYARIDLRVTPDDEVYVIEANPNPLIADDEDMAHAAWASGIKYPELIDTIIKMALARGRK